MIINQILFIELWRVICMNLLPFRVKICGFKSRCKRHSYGHPGKTPCVCPPLRAVDAEHQFFRLKPL